METDDIDLIRAYLAGAEEAFGELFRRYRLPLFGYLRGMLSEADAEDVFQKTWVRVCRKLDSYRDDGKFQAWIFRIGRNLALDLLRRRKRLQEVPQLEEQDGAAGQEYDPWLPEQEGELLLQLDRALEQLSPEQRAVFQMRRRQLSFRVIAGVQNCPVNTAVQRMRYAMKRLCGILRKETKDR